MRGHFSYKVLILALIPLLLAGCLFGPAAPKQEIDPPQDKATTSQKTDGKAGDSSPLTDGAANGGKNSTDGKSDEEKTASSRQAEVELYFKSAEGYVVPYSITIPAEEGIAKAALSQMVAGSELEKSGQLPKGFSALLPKGTTISLDINKKNKVANVDLSKEFLNYKEEEEEQLLGALTWALTAWNSVEQVNVWVNGKQLDAMPKGKTPAKGLTRQNTALNVELGDGVQISNSMPVTLYFLGQSGEHVYFVPITRMVPRDGNIAQVALEQLIAGPNLASHLSTDLLDNLVVNDVTVKERLVQADFGEQLLEYGKEDKVSERAIQAIVLSLTENTGAEQVKLSVNGKTNVNTQQVSLAKPVLRPKKVNPYGL
ncbi:GerMN domain-containing protein [Numidum massiliense]|uniref:GerMN domain-containing protein n=1 Tax=Numidum massiliense TaxID=1522315 RepID=UPI0006D5A21F|nr:GerMN domain-containing protein [Numidum massiliense]